MTQTNVSLFILLLQDFPIEMSHVEMSSSRHLCFHSVEDVIQSPGPDFQPAMTRARHNVNRTNIHHPPTIRKVEEGCQFAEHFMSRNAASDGLWDGGFVKRGSELLLEFYCYCPRAENHIWFRPVLLNKGIFFTTNFTTEK